MQTLEISTWWVYNNMNSMCRPYLLTNSNSSTCFILRRWYFNNHDKPNTNCSFNTSHRQFTIRQIYSGNLLWHNTIPTKNEYFSQTNLKLLNDSKLTHWNRDNIAAIPQTTFWKACSWMNMHEFRLRFHWSLLLRFELTLFQHWFR